VGDDRFPSSTCHNYFHLPPSASRYFLSRTISLDRAMINLLSF